MSNGTKIQNELCHHHTVFQDSDKDDLGYTKWILMGKNSMVSNLHLMILHVESTQEQIKDVYKFFF